MKISFLSKRRQKLSYSRKSKTFFYLLLLNIATSLRRIHLAQVFPFFQPIIIICIFTLLLIHSYKPSSITILETSCTQLYLLSLYFRNQYLCFKMLAYWLSPSIIHFSLFFSENMYSFYGLNRKSMMLCDNNSCSCFYRISILWSLDRMTSYIADICTTARILLLLVISCSPATTSL